MSEHVNRNPGQGYGVAESEGMLQHDSAAGLGAVTPELPAVTSDVVLRTSAMSEERPGGGVAARRRWMRQVMLDACLLGMGMLLIALVVGACSAGGLVLLAGGAMEVMVFAGIVGVLIGVTVAMIVQVVFLGGMARPVRLCSLLLVVWGLTLIPLCCVGVSSVMDPQYSGELNRFVFTRSETTAMVVGVLLLLELLAWLALVVRVVRRSMCAARH